jgi:membrane protease YdiL (CAAX protease family)
VGAVFMALEVTGVADGLGFPVPLIVALAVARALGHTAWASRRRRQIGLLVALALTGLAALAWDLDVEGVGLMPAELTLVAAALGGLLASDRVRVLVLRALGLDPASPVHVVVAVAVALTALSSVDLFLALQGEAPAPIPYYASDSVIAILADTALALAGTGWLLTRDLPASLARLGLRRVRLAQAGWAVVAALGMVAVVGVLDWTESVVLPGVHELEDRFDYEFVGISPVVGVALVSVAAGVGEEVLFRGALQPRLGIGLSAALFALAHVQYQVPGILMIFVVGLTLGLLRRRTSTTFAVIVHVVYDLGVFLLELAG